MAAQARVLASSVADQKTRMDFLLIATRLDREADNLSAHVAVAVKASREA
jgi:hypothetical protein